MRVPKIRPSLYPLYGIIAIVLCVLAGGPGPITASQTAKAVIVIWKVGSPYEADIPAAAVPPDLLARALQAGLDLRMRTFPAKGFYEVFTDALIDQSGPDVLAIDNFGILEGAAETPAGPIRGILQGQGGGTALELVQESLDALEPAPQRGWVFLVRGSPRHAAVKDFVLKMTDAGSTPTDVRGILDPDDVKRLEEQAVAAARSYVEADSSALSNASSAQSLAAANPLTQPGAAAMKAGTARTLSIAGNRNLAFVATRIRFEEERGPLVSGPAGVLGSMTVWSVHKKDAGSWRLLAISRDPALDLLMAPELPRLVRLLVNDDASKPPNPAALLTADGVFPVPTDSSARFGDFTWTPSPSADVVCEIAEFYFGHATRFFLSFERPTMSRISTGMLVSGLAWRWRVWSISRSGLIAFSETRSFNH